MADLSIVVTETEESALVGITEDVQALTKETTQDVLDGIAAQMDPDKDADIVAYLRAADGSGVRTQAQGICIPEEDGRFLGAVVSVKVVVEVMFAPEGHLREMSAKLMDAQANTAAVGNA